MSEHTTSSQHGRSEDPNLAEALLEGRLRKLEEHAGFAEHQNDQLHEHLVALSGRIESIARRLSAIESRITGLAERTDLGFDAVAKRLSHEKTGFEPPTNTAQNAE